MCLYGNDKQCSGLYGVLDLFPGTNTGDAMLEKLLDLIFGRMIRNLPEAKKKELLKGLKDLIVSVGIAYAKKEHGIT